MAEHLGRVLLLSIALLATANANWDDTFPGIDLNKLRRFPLSRIRSGTLQEGARVTFDGIIATAASDEIRLLGRGKSGESWEAHMCLSCLDQVWRADLNGDGTQDYVLVGSGPYNNGRTTPLYSLMILLMDGRGLPVPFFTVVYHGEYGVKYVVDLNRDGHAELLISTYDESPSDPLAGPFCSGHWTNQLYRFRGFGLEEVRATEVGIAFPLIHDWTYRGSLCPGEKKPLAVFPPTLHENGTSSKGELTAVLHQEEDDGLIAIDPVAGCDAIQPHTLVYDRVNIREIAFEVQFAEYYTRLLRAIQHDRAPVKLRGIDQWLGGGRCSVNLLWATR